MATSTKLPLGRAISSASIGALTSPRLLLRAYTLADADAVFEAIEETRASLTQWVPDIGSRRTVVEVRAGLTRLIRSAAFERNPIVFGIWEQSARQFVGEVGLYSIDYVRGVGEVGYWIRQRARGKGYVSEAVRTLIRQATAPLGLSRIEAHVAAENLLSRRVVERLGFHVGGRRAPAPHWDGEVGEMLIYALPVSALNLQGTPADTKLGRSPRLSLRW